MTDLEMTALCAEAMGHETVDIRSRRGLLTNSAVWLNVARSPDADNTVYDPLHDDAQAMALVKKFDLDIGAPLNTNMWTAKKAGLQYEWSYSFELNRAIVECVAKMQLAKQREAGRE